MKKCSHCGVTKHETDFNKRTASKDGLAFMCRACSNFYSKNYQEKYPEKHTKRQLEYLKRNPLVGRMTTHNHRIRLKAAGGKSTADDIKELYEKQQGKCAYCEKPLQKYHIDHIIPVSKGGNGFKENLCLACPPCNQRKAARLLEDWLLTK